MATSWLFVTLLSAQYVDFSGAQGLELTGEARIRGKVLRLTPAENDTKGAAWRRERMPVVNGFDTTFRFQFTEAGGLGGGADGIAFVIQNNGPRQLGGYGGSGGFMADGKDQDRRRRAAAITNSLAVFFDTFQNQEMDDPSDNFVVVLTNGSKSRWPSPRLAMNPRVEPNMKDGWIHTARIVFRPPLLEVYLDEKRVVQTPVDLARMMGADGMAYIGFTSGTGGGFANHDILDWAFTGTDSMMYQVSSNITYAKFDCMPGKNLCTPDEAIVEARGDGVFHVILPAHREWGASIPNPSGKMVTLRNIVGQACWDPAAGGCGSAASSKLIQRSGAGKTYFTLQDTQYADNEGFLEFEAVIGQ